VTPWRGPVNWAGMSHPELYHGATVDSEPAAAYELGRDWAELGADMVDQARVLAALVAGTESGWQGTAAESVRSAVLALTRWCDDAGASALAVGECVTEQAAAVETARTQMPEPVDFDWDATLGSFAGAGDPMAAVSDVREHSERARAALERAVDVMVELERWSARIDGEIPRCPLPPEPAGGGHGGVATTDPGALPRDVATTVFPVVGGASTSTAGATGGAAGPGLAGFGGAGPIEAPVSGGSAVSSGLAVPSLGARVRVAAPADGGRVDLPVQSGPGSGRAPVGPGGSGMMGAPGAGAGGGGGQAGEHRTPRFLSGEKVFEPVAGILPVIGDTWAPPGQDPATGQRGQW
jgi:hypothetical protein